MQRSQLCLLSDHPHGPVLFLSEVFLLLYELHSLFFILTRHLLKRDGEKKNLFKYNSCLEGKISILIVSFSKLKSIGCLLKRRFFEAPAWILCLTDVSINTS